VRRHQIDKALVDFGSAMARILPLGDLPGLEHCWATRKAQAGHAPRLRTRAEHYPDKICEAGNFWPRRRAKRSKSIEAGHTRWGAEPEVSELNRRERAERGITRVGLYRRRNRIRPLYAAMVTSGKGRGRGHCETALDVDMCCSLAMASRGYWGGAMKCGRPAKVCRRCSAGI